MRSSIMLFIGCFSFFLLTEVSLASSRCKVTDPTGTPLNIRDGGKNIIGTLRNGTIVNILANGRDDRGKPWALISPQNGRSGWVYREFISCY